MGGPQVQGGGEESEEEAEALREGDECPRCEDGVMYHVDDGHLACDACGFDVFTTKEE